MTSSADTVLRVDYSLKKTMDEDGAVRKVLALGVDEPGVLLHYCESHELDKDNLDIFQRLVKSVLFAWSISRRYVAGFWIIMQSMYLAKIWISI